MIFSSHNIQANNPSEERTAFVFFLFCIWTFVLLARPQDLFPVLAQFRPAMLMGILTMGFVILHLQSLPGPPLFRERQIKYYTALVLIMLLGIPFAHHKGLAFDVVFPTYLFVLIYLFVFYKLVSSFRRLYTVLLTGCLGAGLYSFISLINYQAGRLSFGGMFDPNDIAFFTLGFLPLNLIFISNNNPFWVRLACLVSFGIGVLLVLLTGSRGGFLAFAVAAALLLLFKTRTIGLFLKVVFVVLCLVFVSVAAVDTERYRTLLSLEDDYNVALADEGQGRMGIWNFGVRSMLDNPLTGVGVGGSPRARFLDQHELGRRDLQYRSMHNSVLQVGVETGVIGLAIFLLLSCNVLRIFNQARKKASNLLLVKTGEMGIIGFIGLFIAGFFLTHGYSLYFVFYFVVSAVVSQLLLKEQTPAPRQT